MNEQDRTSIQIKGELRHKTGRIIIATGGVVTIGTIGQRVGRIDRHRPLHIAGDLVEIVDRPVGAVPGTGRAHEREVPACRRAHDADAVRIKSFRRRLGAHDADGALEILPGGRMVRTEDRKPN